MTETVMLPSDVGAALSLQDFIDACDNDPLSSGQDPLPAEKARRLEELVARAVQLAGTLKLVWRRCTEQGSVWETEAYARRIQAVEFLARVVADCLTRTQDIVARTRSHHAEWAAPVQVAELQAELPGVRDILARTQQLSLWLKRERPPVDAEMVRRSQEALNRGEGEPLGDVIARFKNGSPVVKE